ncbi:MAG: hypothetical protein JWL84_1482 [Rhodospirillales bacterium]|nr:hypothetical protein [Rhodospirillales bacterium]
MIKKSACIAGVLLVLTQLAIVERGHAGEATPQSAPARSGTAASGGVAAQSTMPCVEVQIGNDRAGWLDCVNQQLRQSASEQRLPQLPAPYGTNAPPTQLGLFNESAERERMGNAFGHSVHAQRPTK